MKPSILKFISPSSKGHSLAWIAFAIFIMAGIYGSLKIVYAQFGVDADTAHSIMLWYGVTDHGLSWLKSWFFTQDNWLLSLMPFHFIGFAIFGPRPAVVILFGWLIFVLSAFISGVIAYQLKAKKSALILCTILLYFGFYAHEAGYVSYSTSHNITNLFGLISFSLIFSWLRKPNNLKLASLLIILFAGDLSDPWMTAAYILPIGLTSFVFLLFPNSLGISRRNSLKLLLVTIGALILVKSQLLGAWDFLPTIAFLPGNWTSINANSVLLIQDLGGLLNIIPFNRDNPFLPALLSLIVVVSLLVYLVIKSIKSGIDLKGQMVAFLLLASLSVGGIVAAFVVSHVIAERFSARFLLNCAYLIPIALCILIEHNWSRSTKWVKGICIGICTLFLLSGVISNFQELKKPGFTFKETGALALIDFLKKNNLTYGYGPYWAASANAVTAASKLDVIIRPVTFSPVNGMLVAGNRVASSGNWYKESDVPINQKRFFIYIARDYEECPDVNICINGVTRQFGSPIETLKYQNATILVWDHPLLDFHQKQYPVSFNKPIIFNARNNPPTWSGWFSAEEWGTWSDGNNALIVIALDESPKKNIKLLICLLYTSPSPRDRQKSRMPSSA